MKVMVQLAILALLGAGTGAVVLSARSQDSTSAGQSSRGQSSVPVIVEKLRFEQDRKSLEVAGTAAALRSVTLFAEADGRVKSVEFSGGSDVKAGDILLRLGDDRERLTLKSAEIEQARLKRQLERYAMLKDSGAVAETTFQDTEDALALADIAVEQARIALEDRVLKAPFDGRVGLSDIDPGDRITTDTPIATLDSVERVRLDFSIPESLAGRIRPGSKVEISSWEPGSKTIEGEIDAIDSRLNPETRMLPVRTQVENVDGLLRPGASYRVQVETTGGEYPSLPEVAVLWNRDGAHIWRVVDQEVEQIFVEIIRRQQGRALVDGPLNEGDLIVVEGLQSMRAGRKVEATIREPETKAGESAS